jgi:hypothetical protein
LLTTESFKTGKEDNCIAIKVTAARGESHRAYKVVSEAADRHQSNCKVLVDILSPGS